MYAYNPYFTFIPSFYILLHTIETTCFSRFLKTKTTGAQDSQGTNNGPPSAFQTAAATAAGVTTGSVIGHAIGNTLAATLGHGATAKTPSSSYSNDTQELCASEIREFFECASKSEDLDACKEFHNIWIRCQDKYKQ